MYRYDKATDTIRQVDSEAEILTPSAPVRPVTYSKPVRPVETGLALPEAAWEPEMHTIVCGAFAPAARGAQQMDSSETLAKGVARVSLVMALAALPVTIGLTGMAWALGWWQFPGWAAYVTTTLLIWGFIALAGVVGTVKIGYRHSGAGVELHKVSAAETVALAQIASEERRFFHLVNTHRVIALSQLRVLDE